MRRAPTGRLLLRKSLKRARCVRYRKGAQSICSSSHLTLYPQSRQNSNPANSFRPNTPGHFSFHISPHTAVWWPFRVSPFPLTTPSLVSHLHPLLGKIQGRLKHPWRKLRRILLTYTYQTARLRSKISCAKQATLKAQLKSKTASANRCVFMFRLSSVSGKIGY